MLCDYYHGLLAREHREGGRVLFPVALIPIDLIRSWECFDPDSGIDIARELRSYHIPDFSNWSDPAEFERQVAKVVKALRGGAFETPQSNGVDTRTADLVLQRRLSAVEALWATVLDLKQSLSPAIFFFTILVPSEYDSAFEEDALLSKLAS